MTSLPTRTRLGYGAGSVATGAFGTVPGLMLLPYLTDTVGVAPLFAGLVLLLPKAWDVVLNPIAGRISDRTVDARGPRRPWLLRGGLGLVVGFGLIFAAPHLPMALTTLWVLVAFVATATAYAFFQVPYVAMPAELTDSPVERTRLLAWRVVLLALAILIAGGSAPAIRDAIGGRDGYRVMGLVMAVVMLVGVLAAYVGTRNASSTTVAPAAGGLRSQLALVARVRDFRVLLTTFVVQALAFGAMLAGVDYLARHVLADASRDNADGLSTILFVCFVGPGLLLTPLWAAVARRIGKKRSYVVASLLLIVATVVLVGARSLPHGVTFVAVAVVGIGYAGAQVFPMAMLPDVAARDAELSGESRIGIFTGIWTAGETLGLAVGPGLYALILALGGYVSSDGGEVTQPSSAVTAIVLGFSVLPALLVAASLFWLRSYSLKEGTDA
ncbi:MFS transporter [Nocardioides sp. Kera G14]|uniref:MFS transporter n=1 Tax=Nocardioides sp. Kera G14 TaxID=2884264 RepID=UPI001D10237E|nr:MFS transporter [Nocardioides sp. Kera G14]UDY24200.1 MFS transporter [Nocardioides sp. Kera G14]